MKSQWILTSIAAVLGLALGCTVTVTWPGQTTESPLNQATAEILIARVVGDSDAGVTAAIVDDDNTTIELEDRQALRVNDTELTGPNAAGQYTAVVDAANSYEVAVLEPTRGEEYTTIDAPPDFAITAPAADAGASLSGFTLSWSGANANLQVTIELSQTVFGTREVEIIGPHDDTGTRTIAADDLRDFVQGVALTIKVTKTARVSRINGFAAGTLSATVATSRNVQPLP